MKYILQKFAVKSNRCRTPHGVRGLKYWYLAPAQLRVRSHPARGAWIEIGSEIVTGS